MRFINVTEIYKKYGGKRAELIGYYHEFLDMMKKNELFKPILTRVKKNYVIHFSGCKSLSKAD